jgi:ketosteroid isomerase-like protein
MGAQENITTAKAAYAAFTEGDAQAALTLWADDAEFVVRGDSAISGTKRGHDEILTFFGQLGDKNTVTVPRRFIADGDTVVVFNEPELDGEKTNIVEVIDFNDQARIVRFESFGIEGLLKRAYG